MDPRDHPSDLHDGAHCAACGSPVPASMVRILARRDELAFAELPCPVCESVSLAFLPLPDPPPGPPNPVISPDDVLDMHLLLAGWTGDLRSLVSGSGDSARAPGTP